MRYRATALALAGTVLASLPGAAAAQQQRPFADFDPGRCAVASRVIDGLNRHDRRDTTVYSPARDTLFSATVESLRECEGVYGGATSDTMEVLNLARVELLTAQDQEAIAAARRHMGSKASRTPAERAWELYLVFGDLMDGKPARLEEARRVAAELDAMGKPAASVRTLVHAALAGNATQHHDDATMRAEVAAVVKAWHELDDETRAWRQGTLVGALMNRASVEALASGRDAALAVIDSARGMVPTSDARVHAMLRGAERMYRLLGEKAAPLEAQFWYNVGATGTTRPAPGRVSLVVPVYRPCTGGCLSLMDGVRRIAKRFAAEELDVTHRTRTYGFYLDTAPASPLAEAQYDSAYFLHDVGLPGALAIAEVKYSWKADGRRVNEPTTDDQNYPGASVIVVDRKGVVRYVSANWNAVLESRVTRLIEELLKEGAAAAGTPTP